MITVLGDRVLVALPPREDQIMSPGGIVLVKDPDRFYTPTRGIVMQLGEKARTVDLDEVLSIVACHYDGTNAEHLFPQISALTSAPFDVQLGDCVIFPQGAGDELREAGIDYVILHESEIIGIVEPKHEAVAS